MALTLFFLTSSAAWPQIEPAAKQEQIQAHFAAAQEAQERRDYAAAEREYKTLLRLAPNFAELHMNLGLLYQLQNRDSEAMIYFRRALKLKPTLTGANFFLGVDYCKRGEGAQAIPLLKAAADADPTRAETWSWLATAQEMTGEIPAEVTTLKRALQFQPTNVDVLYLLGRAYERLGKDEVATLERLAPKSARSEQLLAESYATSSHWSSAVIHFQNALALAPNLPGLHVELGEVLLRAGRTRQAAQEFEAELQTNPSNLRAIVRRGEVNLIRGDVDTALEDWTKAIAIDGAQAERVLGVRESGFGDAWIEQLPDTDQNKLEQLAPALQARNSPAAQLALALLATQARNTSQLSASSERLDLATGDQLPASCSEASVRKQLEEGRYSGLRACARRALERSSFDLRVQVASAMIETGDYEESLTLLNTLPLAQRKSPEASFWRARVYEKLATAAYLQLYRADPDSYRLHQLMGDLEANREDDRKAMNEYRAAISLKPSLPNLHYSLGHLLWKNLEVSEARKELEAELAINPRHPGALHDLGNTYLSEHQPDKALPYLTHALALDSADPDIHRDLGTAYTQLGQLKKAEVEYKLALPSDHDGSIHYKLARVYQAQKRTEEASREFAASAKMNRESHDKLEKQTQRLAEIERLPQ